MACRTNYSVTVCAGGCGTRPAQGTINDLNREWLTAHGWRCPDCNKSRRAGIAERKRTVKLHHEKAAEFKARFMEEFNAPYQSDHTVLPEDGDSPTGCTDQLGRAPAYRRGRGWGC
jgi:hypothetical protein